MKFTENADKTNGIVSIHDKIDEFQETTLFSLLCFNRYGAEMYPWSCLVAFITFCTSSFFKGRSGSQLSI